VALDNVVNATEKAAGITLDGLAEAKLTLRVELLSSVGGTVVSSLQTVADAAGRWRIPMDTGTLALLGADGAKQVRVTATDAAGNNTLITHSFTLNTVVPNAPLLSALTLATDSGRSNSDAITRNVKPTLTGSAAGAAFVEIYRAGQLQGTATVSSGAFSLEVPQNLQTGTHSFVAVAISAVGDRSALGEPFYVVIDPIAPETTSLQGPTLTNNPRPSFSGIAEPDADVRIYNGTSVLGTVRADAQGQFSWSPASNLADGRYALRAEVEDAAGNLSSLSETWHVRIDTVAPTAPVLGGFGADLSSATAGNINTLAQQMLHGTAEANSQLQVYRDGQLVGVVNVSASGS
jgi:hypothetical protein